jgi:hypothetical protein
MSKRIAGLFELAVKTNAFAKELADVAHKTEGSMFGEAMMEGEAETKNPPPLGAIGRIQEQVDGIADSLRCIDKVFSRILDELQEAQPNQKTDVTPKRTY